MVLGGTECREPGVRMTHRTQGAVFRRVVAPHPNQPCVRPLELLDVRVHGTTFKFPQRLTNKHREHHSKESPQRQVFSNFNLLSGSYVWNTLLAQKSVTQKTTLIVHSPRRGPDQIPGKELSARRYQSPSIADPKDADLGQGTSVTFVAS
jgi:hypothetical protein